MRVRKLTAKEAISMIPDGASIVTGGFIGSGVPEELECEIEKSFLEKNTPRDLTLIYAAGQGDGKDKGLNHFGHDGMLKKVIGGHWGLVPKIQKLAMEEKIEAYNLPQGVIAHMFRDIAGGKTGTLTHVGLNTFVDPRFEGGKINNSTKEEIVKLVEIENKELLFYKAFPLDVALLRGTYADENGNISMEDEAVTLESLSIAQACKNSGGKVIVQVKNVVKAGALDSRLVKIPGIYVDAVVVSSDEKYHMQTFATKYNPGYSGEKMVQVSDGAKVGLSERKIIARRCSMELTPNAVVNLGIGVPEVISDVANEEGVGDKMILTVESGPIGGKPAGGLDFGATTNGEAIIDQPYQFDFYDGGGLDIAFLGLAQCDKKGNINVSKFGPKIAGCGGFINITQNSKKVIYAGTFTAGGLKVECSNGQLKILQEGKVKKFISAVEQITFNGEMAVKNNQPVLYITERAVFEISREGLVLIEVAPGIDIKTQISDLMEFEPIISKNLKLMDQRIFSPDLMGLTL